MKYTTPVNPARSQQIILHCTISKKPCRYNRMWTSSHNKPNEPHHKSHSSSNNDERSTLHKTRNQPRSMWVCGRHWYTRNAIFIIRTLCERAIEVYTTWPVPLFYWLCQSVWQSETRRPLWISTKSWYRWEGLKVNMKPLLGTIGSYKNIYGNIGKYTQIRRGIRQGCVFSTDLSNLYSEYILRDLNDTKGCI